MFTFLLGLIDPVSRIADKIAQYKIAAKNAETDQEKIAAEERTKALEVKRDVMAAEAGSSVNAWVRGFLALPIGILLWKVFVWDKAFGQWTQGSTDRLSPELWNVVMVVLGFYFLFETVRAVKR